MVTGMSQGPQDGNPESDAELDRLRRELLEFVVEQIPRDPAVSRLLTEHVNTAISHLKPDDIASAVSQRIIDHVVQIAGASNAGREAESHTDPHEFGKGQSRKDGIIKSSSGDEEPVATSEPETKQATWKLWAVMAAIFLVGGAIGAGLLYRFQPSNELPKGAMSPVATARLCERLTETDNSIAALGEKAKLAKGCEADDSSVGCQFKNLQEDSKYLKDQICNQANSAQK